MRLQTELQIGPVTDALRARIALGLPVLKGILFALKKDRAERFGGYEKVTVWDLAREYREGDRDYGICFEYAVHDAIRTQHPAIHPLISEVLEGFCNIKSGAQSILFGAEKSGKWALIETAQELINDQSRVLSGTIGQPPKLQRLWDNLTRAMNVQEARDQLPKSVNGLWKSDIFLGSSGEQRWVGATLKTNKAQFEALPGLRVGIYPQILYTDRPYLDANTNLIMCPLPYDGGFMEQFAASFSVIKAFLKNDARTPPPAAVPYAHDRYFCDMLEARREYPVLEVIEGLIHMAQPGLVSEGAVGDSQASPDALAPLPRIIS